MFDTRPLERLSSLMILPSLAVLPLVFGGGMAVIVSVGVESHWIGLGLGCCAVAFVPVFGLPLLALLRWSRTGRARPWLEEVGDALGGGEVQTASYVFSLLSPRLTGTVDGLPYRLDLRRQAGVLSPPTVGNRFLLFGWMFQLRVEAEIGARIGFLPENTPTFGASLLRLTDPEPVEGLIAFTGGTDRGRELARRPEVQEAARRALDAIGGLLLRIGPDGIDVSGILPPGVTPGHMAALLRALADLARACR